MNLTPREKEALQMLANGLSQKQTAAEMGINQSMLERHLQIAKARLQASNTLHAVVLAVRGGAIK